MHKSPEFNPQHQVKWGMVGHAYKPRTRQSEEDQKFRVILDYIMDLRLA